MNYSNIYNSIIENRKTNKAIGYVESHHIIPRCLKGTDKSDNIIDLTAREHFICHYLLSKMFPKHSFKWYKTNHAFMMMKCDAHSHRYFNSRLYEHLKRNFSETMSNTQQGKNNSCYGTMWICNVDLKQNKKIYKTQQLPSGWIRGRNKWRLNKSKHCQECGKDFISDKNIKWCSVECKQRKQKIEAEKYFNLFKHGKYNSINDFLRTGIFPRTQPALIRIFKKYIPEYNAKERYRYKSCV